MKDIRPLIAAKTLKNVTMMVERNGVSTYEMAAVYHAFYCPTRERVFIKTMDYTLEFAAKDVRSIEQATDRSVWVGVQGMREEFQLDY